MVSKALQTTVAALGAAASMGMSLTGMQGPEGSTVDTAANWSGYQTEVMADYANYGSSKNSGEFGNSSKW